MVASARRRSTLALAPVLALLCTACGKSDEPEPGAPREAASAPDSPASDRRGGRGPEAPPAAAIGEEAYDSSELGALFGEVRFEGQPPERFRIGAADKDECQHHPEVQHLSDIAIVNDGKVQYAYVYLKSGIDEARIPPAPAASVTLDQRGCIYTPHVVALRTGQKLLVANSDPTTHNVNFKAKLNNVLGNKSMGQGQAPLEFTYTREEHEIPFKCDVHPWMGAVVHVEEHPWFSVTGERGEFRIEAIPPGEYVVEVLHETFGKERASVTIAAGRANGVALTLREK